jgi:hypothetical protein
MPRFFVTAKIVVDCDTIDNAIYYANSVLSEGIGTIDDYIIEEAGEE